MRSVLRLITFLLTVVPIGIAISKSSETKFSTTSSTTEQHDTADSNSTAQYTRFSGNEYFSSTSSSWKLKSVEETTGQKHAFHGMNVSKNEISTRSQFEIILNESGVINNGPVDYYIDSKYVGSFTRSTDISRGIISTSEQYATAAKIVRNSIPQYAYLEYWTSDRYRTTEKDESFYGKLGIYSTISFSSTEGKNSLGVYWQQRLAGRLFAYVSPFLIVVGTVGNSLAVIALQHPLFRASSTGFILTALATADIFVLNTGLMDKWLRFAFGINIRNLTGFGCKIHFLLTYYLHQLSSWTLILLTVERSISVCAPLRCKEMCSRRRIGIAWVLVAFLLFAEHIFFFPAFGLYPSRCWDDATSDSSTVSQSTARCRECVVREDWFHFWDVSWSYIDAFLGDWFPFCVVFVGNIVSVSVIARSHRARKKQMGVTTTASSGKLLASTTAMLIGVSAMFIVLSLPIDILFIYYAGKVIENEAQAVYNLAYAVVTLLYYANNSFGFLMYLVSGSKFRRAFVATFTCGRRSTVLSSNINRGSIATN